MTYQGSNKGRRRETERRKKHIQQRVLMKKRKREVIESIAFIIISFFQLFELKFVYETFSIMCYNKENNDLSYCTKTKETLYDKIDDNKNVKYVFRIRI